MAYSANEDYLMANRFRLRFTFWLDMRKTDEAELAETIETLKLNRSFAATIRDGIRLICDLRAGQTDVLFELFPWIKDATQSASAKPIDSGLQEQIARLEALLLAQGNVPIQIPLTRATSEKPTRTAGKSLIEINSSPSKDRTKTISQNFMSSMQGLASGFFD
jgi:hypothetical protein